MATVKNLAAKTVEPIQAYEYWAAVDWVWAVLKKWQVDDNKPYARWFCKVYTPFVPEGEMGDVYVADIKSEGTPVDRDTAIALISKIQGFPEEVQW